jgi:hypothetical protein
LSPTTNTVISRAILEAYLPDVTGSEIDLQLFGYMGNGIPDVSDFNRGRFVTSEYREWIEWRGGNMRLNFDVTDFVNDLRGSNDSLDNGNAFIGFGIRTTDYYRGVTLRGIGYSSSPTLEITTVDVAEPVPEPTTIFGSAIGLCLGGWLKRKKSALQNKTMSQG